MIAIVHSFVLLHLLVKLLEVLQALNATANRERKRRELSGTPIAKRTRSAYNSTPIAKRLRSKTTVYANFLNHAINKK